MRCMGIMRIFPWVIMEIMGILGIIQIFPGRDINYNQNTGNNVNFPGEYNGMDSNNGNDDHCCPLYNKNHHPSICLESSPGGQRG